jgi:transketolase
MAIHGGLRPYAATFFVFSDYARPSMRLAALMEIPVIYVMTHDSIGVGEDGPTHQPVEHLAAFRAMPGMHVVRPADANETAWAWRHAVARRDGPTTLVLTRQKVPVLDRSRYGAAKELLRGAYVLAPEKGESADLVILATGSEVSLALAAREKLLAEGIDVRVVSMPCWELFRAQSRDYRDQVLPPMLTRRIAVEAGSPAGWREWVGDAGEVVALPRFGASAPGGTLYEKFGITVEAVVERARVLLSG